MTDTESPQPNAHSSNFAESVVLLVASIASLILGLIAPAAWVIQTSPELTPRSLGVFLLLPLPFLAVANLFSKARIRWYDD
jgi:hypothetical protein